MRSLALRVGALRVGALRVSALRMSALRVSALVLRYWYLFRGSWPRVLELTYWPTVQMLMWGVMQEFLASQAGIYAGAAGVLIGSVLLWDILFRGQLGFSISFFEEMWSRNLGHLLVSPLRPLEFVAALMTMSVARTLIGLLPTTLLAWWLFGFSIYGVGPVLVVFFFNLMVFGWALGLVVAGIVLRHGLGAESLAWAVIFICLPLCAVYYPVETLPVAVQWVSWALPPTYVFEGMRGILLTGAWRGDLLWQAALLNVAYLGLGVAVFLAMLNSARDRGSLLQIGE